MNERKKKSFIIIVETKVWTKKKKKNSMTCDTMCVCLCVRPYTNGLHSPNTFGWVSSIWIPPKKKRKTEKQNKNENFNSFHLNLIIILTFSIEKI